MDMGACYEVRKCREVVFKEGKMKKAEGLAVLKEEKKEARDPDQNEVYKFLGCEQADKIDVKHVIERVKTEINKTMEQLVGMNLYDENLIKALNYRVNL